MPEPYSPFKHMYCIDLLQQVEEGGIELYIVAHNKLLPTDEVMDELKRKVKFYLAEIDTLGFQAVWKHPPPELTSIIVATLEELHPTVKSFIDGLRGLVEDGNARLKTRVFESEYPEWLVDKPAPELSLDAGKKLEIRKQLERMQFALAKRGFIASVHPSRFSLTCAPCQAKTDPPADGPYLPHAYLVEFEKVVVKIHANCCNIAFNANTGGWEVDISEKVAPGPGNVFLRDSYTSTDAAMQAVRNCYSVE